MTQTHVQLLQPNLLRNRNKHISMSRLWELLTIVPDSNVSIVVNVYTIRVGFELLKEFFHRRNFMPLKPQIAVTNRTWCKTFCGIDDSQSGRRWRGACGELHWRTGDTSDDCRGFFVGRCWMRFLGHNLHTHDVKTTPSDPQTGRVTKPVKSQK